MNKTIADIIDKLVLKDLHRKKSVNSYFRAVDEHVDDLSSFYPIPAIPSIKFEQQKEDDNYKIGRFSFESEIDNGLSNKYSSGLFYENKNYSQ